MTNRGKKGVFLGVVILLLLFVVVIRRFDGGQQASDSKTTNLVTSEEFAQLSELQMREGLMIDDDRIVLSRLTFNTDGGAYEFCEAASRREAAHRGKHDCIHVITSANGSYLISLLALINSVRINTDHMLFFHVLVPPGESTVFRDYLQQAAGEMPIEIIEFNVARVTPLIRVWEGKHPQVYLNPFNYARFYLPEIFPAINTMIYLDADTLCVTDLANMQNMFLERHDKSKFLMAVRGKDVLYKNGKPAKNAFTCGVLNCADDEISASVPNRTQPFFNAGVFVTDLARWREVEVTKTAEYWLRANTKRKLWRWGSQGPLVLVFYDRWEEIDVSWNNRNARKWGAKERAIEAPKVNIFHFTTSLKPWHSTGVNVTHLWPIWCPYFPLEDEFWFCRPPYSEENLRPSSPNDYTFLRRIMK